MNMSFGPMATAANGPKNSARVGQIFMMARLKPTRAPALDLSDTAYAKITKVRAAKQSPQVRRAASNTGQPIPNPYPKVEIAAAIAAAIARFRGPIRSASAAMGP